MVRQSQDQERNGREDGRQQFPFEGLHVYQRAQEAWLASLAGADDSAGRGDRAGDPSGDDRDRAARPRTPAQTASRNDGFSSALEDARASLHAAAALIEQRSRRGAADDPELRTLLMDGSRMLGALIRTVSQRGEAVEAEAVV